MKDMTMNDEKSNRRKKFTLTWYGDPSGTGPAYSKIENILDDPKMPGD